MDTTTPWWPRLLPVPAKSIAACIEEASNVVDIRPARWMVRAPTCNRPLSSSRTRAKV